MLRTQHQLAAAVQVEVDEASMQESVETKESQSYPGLLSKVATMGLLLLLLSAGRARVLLS